MIGTTSLIEWLVQLVEGADPLGTFLLSLALLYLGNIAGNWRKPADRVARYAAAVVMVGYTAYALLAYGRAEPACLLGIIWRTLLAAAITYGAVALVASILIGLITPPTKTISRWIESRLARISGAIRDRRRRRQYELEQQEAAKQALQRAPVVEQQRRAAQEAARRHDELNRTRDRMQFDLRLEFKNVRKLDREILTNDEFESQLNHALAPDDTSEIDRRVAALREVFSTVLANAPKPITFESLADEFMERHAAIDRSNFDEQIKAKLHRWVNLRGERDIQRIVSKGSP